MQSRAWAQSGSPGNCAPMGTSLLDSGKTMDKRILGFGLPRSFPKLSHCGWGLGESKPLKNPRRLCNQKPIGRDFDLFSLLSECQRDPNEHATLRAQVRKVNEPSIQNNNNIEFFLAPDAPHTPTRRDSPARRGACFSAAQAARRRRSCCCVGPARAARPAFGLHRGELRWK